MPGEFDPALFTKLPAEMFEEVVRYLPVVDLFDFMTASKEIATRVTAYMDRLISRGYIVHPGTGVPVDPLTQRQDINKELLDGTLVRFSGNDPTTSILDALKGSDIRDATVCARVIARRSGALVEEANQHHTQYSLDVLERIKVAFEWFEENGLLRTAADKPFTRQKDESIFDLARRWEDYSGVLAPF